MTVLREAFDEFFRVSEGDRISLYWMTRGKALFMALGGKTLHPAHTSPPETRDKDNKTQRSYSQINTMFGAAGVSYSSNPAVIYCCLTSSSPQRK